MKTKWWIPVCVLAMACGGEDKKPEHILSKEQMAGLLTDMQIAETRVNDLQLDGDSTREVYDRYQAYLLDKHLVKDSAFYESLSYYLSRPSDLNIIHETILDTLNFRLQKIEAQEEKDKGKSEESDEEGLRKIPAEVFYSRVLSP